ncbi:MAG: class I SAM-dependent methyltransferase [Candidatus Erginobacter occultus]|nr:class I SAM-dependent methyltransferase [Candidatus Erginobacter occultus]
MEDYDYGGNGVRCDPDASPERILADHRARYRWAADFVRRVRPPGSPVTVLDLAAGAGYGSESMSNSADRVIGMELSAAAINECRCRRKEKLDFIQADALRLPLVAESCDFVVSFETVEHIPLELVPEYFGEVYRVLRSGGWLLISTPNRRLTSPFQLRDNPANPHHRFEWTEGEFVLAVKKFFRIESAWGQRFQPRLLTALSIRKQLARFRHPLVPFHKQWSSWYNRLYSPERGSALVRKAGIFQEPRYCILAAQRLSSSSSGRR